MCPAPASQGRGKLDRDNTLANNDLSSVRMILFEFLSARGIYLKGQDRGQELKTR